MSHINTMEMLDTLFEITLSQATEEYVKINVLKQLKLSCMISKWKVQSKKRLVYKILHKIK